VPLKILLADDSMIAQNMGKKILTEAGYDVTTVSNGSAAIKKFSELHPDILLLDVYMPGYSGLEVTEKIRSSPETAHLPILLTVGKLEPFRPEEGMRAKADGVIVKPFEATDLIAVVDQLAQRVSARPPAPPSVPEPVPASAPAPVVVAGPEVSVGKESGISQPFGAGGSTEQNAPMIEAFPEPSSAPSAAPEENLLQAFGFGAIAPAQPLEPESPPTPAPLLPAEVQVAVAALDFTSGGQDLPAFVIPPQTAGGTPPPASQVASEFRPLEIRLEPMLEPTAEEPQPVAGEPAGVVPGLTEPVPIDFPSATPAEAPEIPLSQPAESASPSGPVLRVDHHEPVAAHGHAEPVAPAATLAEELPEFAFFTSVFGSPRDGQFETRLTDTMEAFDTAATVPEPRPVPPTKITELDSREVPGTEGISDPAGASFEAALRELLEGQPGSAAKPATVEAAAAPAFAEPFAPPARVSELDTSFDDDIDRVLRAALHDPEVQLGAVAEKQAVPAPEVQEKSSDTVSSEEIGKAADSGAGGALHAEPSLVPEPWPSALPVNEPPLAVELPAEASIPAVPPETLTAAPLVEPETLAPPARVLRVALLTEEPDVTSAWGEAPSILAAPPPAAPPKPAIAATPEPVAEQIVDRVLQRLRPELVEEVRRMLNNPAG
jgi:CheY-like chemotaxis protein